LIAYFIGNISVKKYQNPFVCFKVIASQRWDFFETRCKNVSEIRLVQPNNTVIAGIIQTVVKHC